MSTVKLIKSTSTDALNKYLGRPKKDNDLPRVLFEAGQHCRADTAVAEFRALRREHGMEGATRKPPATYVPSHKPGEATHLKVGKNWRAAREGETATHLKINPNKDAVKRTEVNHWIVSFGLHEVNPDDPEGMQRAFEFVVEHWEQDRPGVQAKFVAHGDALGSKHAIERGEGGKFHVHLMENVAIHTEMEMGGRVYRPGMRTAGPMTDIDMVRERNDEFLRTRGCEFDLVPQVLPSPVSKEARAVRRTKQDFWAREKGAISDQDLTREAVETALENLNTDDLAGLDENQKLHRLGDEITACSGITPVYRTVKTTGEDKIRSFSVPGRKQNISASRLGERYSPAGLTEQLELIEQGQWVAYERPQAGPAKPMPQLTNEQLRQTQQQVNQIAETERARQQAGQRQVAARQAQRALQEAAASRHTEVLDALRTEEMTEAELAQQIEELTEQYGPEMQMRRDEIEEMTTRISREVTPEQLEHAVELGLREDVRDGTMPLRLQQLHAQRLANPQREADAQQRSAQETHEHETEQERETEQADAQATGRQLDRPRAEQTERAKTTPAQQPRALRQVGILRGDQMKDRELIAIVRSERGDGGAYVDLQLAAHDLAARDQAGLYLQATRRQRSDGRVGTQTWTQLSTKQYQQLQRAAGDNRVEVDGRECLAIRGNVMPAKGGHGYTINPVSARPSQLEPIGDDVMDRQRASEDAAREKQQQRQQASRTADDFIQTPAQERDEGLSL